MNTKHDINAKVQISARLVSPDTAEVMAVSEGMGEANRKGVKVNIRDSGNVRPDHREPGRSGQM